MFEIRQTTKPAVLPRSGLRELTIEDVPEDLAFQVGSTKDHFVQVDSEGTLWREGDQFVAEAEYLNTRKYWYSPLGLEQFTDSVRRSVETRQRTRGDVELQDYDDDGAYVRLSFRIVTGEKNAARALDVAEAVAREVEEAAERAADEVGQRVAEVASRLSGWGSATFDALVDRVQNAASSDDRGRSLEELTSRLLATVPGFVVSGGPLTATEEIDISVLNDSQDPRLRREGALVLVECKHWSGKCWSGTSTARPSVGELAGAV